MTHRGGSQAVSLSGACHLCAQIAGDAADDLLHGHLHRDGYQRTLCRETAEFAVIPSIGPLVTGHVLVIPRRHMRSFVRLSVREREAGEDLAAGMARALASTLARRVHRFEHGSSRYGGVIACSVEHAHLHLVPSDVDVWPLIENAGTWIELGSRSLASVAGDFEYLMYEHPDGTRLVWITDDVPIPSQFMRRAFAAALGAPDRWDWRRDPRPDVIQATLACLSDIDPRGAQVVSHMVSA